MKHLLLTFLVFFSHAHAEMKLCDSVDSKHRYPLSESVFTKQNFEHALASLKDTDIYNAYDYDFFDIESDLMYIKGYMYKLHIKNNPGNPNMVIRFCNFMTNEAYLRHE
jgi:hypothetical protein